MRAARIETYCKRLGILLDAGNFVAARNVIDEAEKTLSSNETKWDMDFVELGMDHKTAYCLNCAGLFRPRDIKTETYDSLQEIEQISCKRAAYIMEFLNELN